MSPDAPLTFRSLLDTWMHADAAMVVSFNEAHIVTEPSPEAKVQFIELRMANMATAMATALSMLAQGEDDGK